jgi:NAD(P)-dependent dehydrogenase (short-subunit alcohol dehydrogenase family)
MQSTSYADALFSLTGRVALVTGATSGLGLHFGRLLHQFGARVAFAGRRLERVADEIKGLGDRALPVVLDITDSKALVPALEMIEEHWGPCDLLVNNAGIAVTKPLLDQTDDDWAKVVDVNLTGAFRMTREVARRLIAAGRPGTIVNVSSIIGLRTATNVTSYAASKAALIHMTRNLAVELARHRIRVNCIAPGYIETDLNREFFGTEQGQALIKRIPTRRLGTVDELSGPLLLLASTAGAHMTGAVLVVDGGHSINSL